MPWSASPFFSPRGSHERDLEASPRQVIMKGVKDGFLEPSEHFTAHQALYVFIPHGIIAAIISGVINLAIAEGMYGTTKDAINLFQFPNTLVGDATVTIIIQCIITWMIELVIVNQDLKHGKVQPMGNLRQPTSRMMRWYFLQDGIGNTHKGNRWVCWVQFLIYQGLCALCIAIISFAILIGPCVALLMLTGTRSGGDWTFMATLKPSIDGWKPQIFKGILGAVLGLLTTPLFALFWLTRCGWGLKTNEEKLGQT